MEDKDANCRLRHGLNVHCLAKIFQYLHTPDLYTVGEMNEFYNQIIADLVISKHEVNFEELHQRDITISQVFERYGRQIRKFYFEDFSKPPRINQLIESITQYCAADQLKSVTFILIGYSISVDLPIQFRDVEKFIYNCGAKSQLSVQFSESLRHLTLSGMVLNPNFDWTNLKNLTVLDLYCVDGINAQNFIEFIHHRPNLKEFHHNRSTFGNSTQDVCDAVAKYCGKQILEYHGEMPHNEDEGRMPGRHLFDFVAAFKNMKEVSLTTHRTCGGDIIDALKRLAENDSIEILKIACSGLDLYEESDNVNCIFQENPNHKGADMRQFSHLKTIKIFVYYGWKFPGQFRHAKACEPFKWLSLYSSQLMSNVENLLIEFFPPSWDFIKFERKLRQLYLNVYCTFPLIQNQAAILLSTFKDILGNRQNEHILGDFIEIKFKEKGVFDLFVEINGNNDSIKLTLL